MSSVILFLNELQALEWCSGGWSQVWIQVMLQPSLFVKEQLEEKINTENKLYGKFCAWGTMEGLYLHNLQEKMCYFFIFLTQIVSYVAFHTLYIQFDSFSLDHTKWYFNTDFLNSLQISYDTNKEQVLNHWFY